MSGVLRDGAVTLLILLAAGTGLFFHGSNDIIYAPALGALFAAAAMAILLRRDYTLAQGPVLWLLLALWAWLTLSLCWSFVPFASLQTWLVFAAFPLAMLSFGETQFLAPALLAGLAGLAATDLTLLSIHPDIYGPRAHWPLLDANNLAALLNLGFAPALAAALARDRVRLPSLSAALMLAGLLATQSRAGLLAAVVSVALVVWLVCDRRSPRRVAAIVGLTAAFLLPLLLNGLLARAGTRMAAAPGGDANIAARFAIWHGTLRLIAAHPWRGTGFGTFYLFYPAVRPPLLDNSTGNWAHNDLLQYAAETGIAGAVLLGALIFAIGFRAASVLRRAAPGPRRAEIAGLAAGLMTLALQMQVEFQLYVLPILIVAGAWIARLLVLFALPARTVAVWQRPWPLPLITLGILLPLILLTGSSAAGIFYFRRAAADLKSVRIEQFLAANAMAQRVAPAAYAEPRVQLAGFYLDLGGRRSTIFSDRDRTQMLSAAGDLLKEAQSANPAWAEIDRKQAKLATLQTPPDLAAERRLLTSAVQKDPMNFQARRELALLRMQDGDAADALGLLRTGLAYPHDEGVTQDYESLIDKIAPYAALQTRHAAGQTAP